jgi:hypothetical protein
MSALLGKPVEGFCMSKCKSDGQAAGSPSPPVIVCVLVVDNTFDEFEVEICCQRTDGVDHAFATSKDLLWLRAERPSDSTLAYSAETLLFHIIWSCLYYVGEPVDVRSGLLSKKHVDAIISSVRIEMDETKKANEEWRASEIAPNTFEVRSLSKLNTVTTNMGNSGLSACSALFLQATQSVRLSSNGSNFQDAHPSSVSSELEQVSQFLLRHTM